MHRDSQQRLGGEVSEIVHSTGRANAVGLQPLTALNAEFLGLLQEPIQGFPVQRKS